ncbi:RagB/SusD family nutrient uptake outer membrane protein [Paraflavitalea soli]|uniref:RagB/SusD family nutrient uptake outer membrane protein n=1 Tax=Paraflavitalea soli TaxID=2315862 RepID=A0A3B7MQR6_9BACT|nr:RagB/SusD family nutrient uptake outer membrane protein [Paraflavitalea soli]AXY76884.1 RagB/SusD family nutrient uptake outer membrane protein [Paraflavitalea soli]
MKRIKFNIKSSVLLAITIIAANGCSKSFIDVPLEGAQPSEQFWKNAEDATKAVNAMYAYTRAWPMVGFATVAVESLGSDDTEKGSSTGDASYLDDFDNFTVGPSSANSSGQVYDFWKGQYLQINYCNQILDNVPAIEMDANLKNRYLAEAKFLRAYSYFRLVRAFGDVPLRLTVPKDAAQFNIPRTPKTEVWAAIEKDLSEAAAVLPQSYGPADVGHATKGAALALNAKVAMYQKKWDQVLALTNQVMGMGYDLYADYEKLFRIQNENSVESIFEVQAALIPDNKDASNSQYSQIQGVRGMSPSMGWGFNVPTADLAASYEADDPRRDATIIFRGEITPQGDAIPAAGDNPRYNQKSYVPQALMVSGFTEGSQQNFRVIRFAEVLLMNAEAANELGGANTALALTSLNRVRARARGANPITVLPPVVVTDQAQLRAAIWRERRSELAMENDRYFDVIRQGRAATLFGPKGWKANKNEVWPIPQAEIDISAGVLTQNTGY